MNQKQKSNLKLDFKKYSSEMKRMRNRTQKRISGKKPKVTDEGQSRSALQSLKF